MVDAAIIHQCADPDLKPAIVEKFIRAVGSPDPLTVTVRAGNRVILVQPPKTPDDAMELVRRYVGQAMVRVGVTQYPAGLGVTDASELKPDLVDACANIRMGTALFGKVYRIVVKWYGTPADEAFRDAVDAWTTGYFDGRLVFDQLDPEDLLPKPNIKPMTDGRLGAAGAERSEPAASKPGTQIDPNEAGIRIDLNSLGAATPK